MKTCVASTMLLLSCLMGFGAVYGQGAPIPLEPLGLAEYTVTSLSLYGDVLAAGTDGSGVFWQLTGYLPDSSWVHIGLDGLAVRTVYAHKSGPIGWAIGAGVMPAEGDTVFVYCSFMGQDYVPNSEGISSELTMGVFELDGFPDPSVCGETYAAGGRAVYRRDFGGATWTPVHIASIEGEIVAVRAREEIPGVVLAGGAEGFAGFLLIKSLDFGDSWVDISPLAFVQGVDFLGEAAEFIFAATSEGVLRSIDGGDTWEEVLDPPGPTGDMLTDLVIDPTRPRIWAAGTSWTGESPLFYSNDLGDTWQRVVTDLTGSFTDLGLDLEGNLYLAHSDAGVLRLDTALVDVSDDTPAHEPVVLYQNFPNPFNPDTTIPFVLRQESHVVLTLMDVSGRRVRTLVDATLGRGLHVASWDGVDVAGKDAPSGVYFYRLQAGDHLAIKRMALVR